ncbi:MAG: hypothetical protein EBY62_05760 [Cellvibrionales bacterium]|nr:hypothetical protein [Cellvibrionales bacterium]
MQNILVLGATGSIGLSTLDVVARHPEQYRAYALAANRSVEAMVALCTEHKPAHAVMFDADAAAELERRLEDIRTPMDVAVIGCIVNGPGEAREADVGLTGATPNNLIYLNGEPDHKVSNQDFVDHLESVIRERAAGLESARAKADADTIARSS